MILPLRVFGRSAVTRIFSGRAIAPIFVGDVILQLLLELRRIASSLLRARDAFTITNAAIAVPLIS